MIDAQELMEYLPHRYPFLLVDKIIEIQQQKRAVGIKNVTINEPFFQGHFPDHPIMPGVLIIEALSQVGGVMCLSQEGMKGQMAYFAGIDKAKFRRPVVPGDQLRLEVEMVKMVKSIAKFHGRAMVDGQLVAEGDFTVSFVEQAKKAQIDPTATIHPSAELGKDVKIGANVIIGPEVKIGNGTTIEANVIVEKWTTIGEDCSIGYGAIIGGATQDKKFKGERSFVEIGDRNVIREYVTINRATGKDLKTILGNDNLLLSYVHIGHDCILGNGIVISNAAQIAGHVEIDDNCVIGGMAGITQFCRVGAGVMIGGYSKVNQDIPPYTLVEGQPACVRGLNQVGMQRRNVTKESMAAMKKAYKYLYRSKLNISQALEEIDKEVEKTPEIIIFTDFLKVPTDRGIAKRPAKKGA